MNGAQLNRPENGVSVSRGESPEQCDSGPDPHSWEEHVLTGDSESWMSTLISQDTVLKEEGGKEMGRMQEWGMEWEG